MSNVKNLKGQKFGRLTVVEFIGTNHRNEAVWKCLCECGNCINVRSYPLKSGHTKSCGCLREDELRTRKKHPHKKSHGMSNSRIYNAWCNMKGRCYNPKSTFYRIYGGRGITVCDEWKNNFYCFYEWSIKNGYDDSLEIDRINNDLGYSPDNCRWVSRKKQMNNIRNNKTIFYKGNKFTINELSEEYGLDNNCLKWRIENGWDLETALKTPSKKRYIEFNGEIKTVGEWAKEYNLVYSCLLWRINNGWEIEKALKTPGKKQLK